jgi:hypothetical protein
MHKAQYLPQPVLGKATNSMGGCHLNFPQDIAWPADQIYQIGVLSIHNLFARKTLRVWRFRLEIDNTFGRRQQNPEIGE